MINGAGPHAHGGGSVINRWTVLRLGGCELLPRWWISYGKGEVKLGSPVWVAQGCCVWAWQKFLERFFIISLDKYFWKCNNLNFPEAWIWIFFFFWWSYRGSITLRRNPANHLERALLHSLLLTSRILWDNSSFVPWYDSPFPKILSSNLKCGLLTL